MFFLTVCLFLRFYKHVGPERRRSDRRAILDFVRRELMSDCS